MFILLLGVCFSEHLYHNTVWFMHTLQQGRQMNQIFHRMRWPHAFKRNFIFRIFVRDETFPLTATRTYVSPNDWTHYNLLTMSYFKALHFKNHLYGLHISREQASNLGHWQSSFQQNQSRDCTSLGCGIVKEYKAFSFAFMWALLHLFHSNGVS